MLKLTKIAVLSLILGFFVLKPPLVIAENWPVASYNPARTGFNPNEKQLRPPLKLKWHFPSSRIGYGPVLDNNNVYVAGVDGHVYAVKRSDGGLLWDYQMTSAAAAAGSPALADMTVSVLDRSGVLYTFNKVDGTVLWQKQLDDFPWSAPAISEFLLIVGNTSGQVLVLDSQTGAERWRHKLEGIRPGRITIGNGMVFVVDDSHDGLTGTLYAIDLSSGGRQWSKKLEWSSGPLALDSETQTLYLLQTNGKLITMNASDGRLKWQKQVFRGDEAMVSTPAIDGEHIYVSTGSYGQIVALRKQAGETVWVQGDINNELVFVSPVIANNQLFLGTQAGTFAILDKNTGNVLWTYKSSDISTEAAVVDGVLYIGSREGGLYAFESQNPGVYVSESGPPKTPAKTSGAKLNLTLFVPIIVYLLWIAGTIFYVSRIKRNKFRTDELYRFASQMVSAGKSQQEIANSLRQAGWPEVKIKSVLSLQIPWWGKIIILGSSLGVFAFSELLTAGVMTGVLRFTQDHSSWPIFNNLGSWYGNLLLSRAIMPLALPISLIITLMYLWWLGITKKVLAGRIATIAKTLIFISLGLAALATLFGIILILMIAMGKVN